MLEGTLSSYGYVLMLIHYLQRTVPPVLPVLQQINESWDGSAACGSEPLTSDVMRDPTPGSDGKLRDTYFYVPRTEEEHNVSMPFSLALFLSLSHSLSMCVCVDVLLLLLLFSSRACVCVCVTSRTLLAFTRAHSSLSPPLPHSLFSRASPLPPISQF